MLSWVVSSCLDLCSLKDVAAVGRISQSFSNDYTCQAHMIFDTRLAWESKMNRKQPIAQSNKLVNNPER